MPTADARIPTERASRYLTQLCRHLGQTSRMRHQAPSRPDGQLPPTVEQVDWSDTMGTIRFSQGTCTLSATAGTLTVRIDADDEDTLLRLKEGVTRRLETVGRRDHLTVHWRQTDSTAGVPPDAAAAVAATDHSPASRSHRIGRMLALAGVAAVAVLVHLGLFGGALAASPWASWGTNIVLALILLKLVAVAAHVVLGRVGFRHLRSLRHRRRDRIDVSVTTENPARPHERSP
jgi:hypothetical protein